MAYEYQQVEISKSQMFETMNMLGHLGWEAFFVSPSLVTGERTVVVYFKRPLPSQAVTP